MPETPDQLPLTLAELDELSRLEAAAAKAPWRADTVLGGRKPIVGTPEVDGEAEIIFEGYDAADCALAAALRNSARQLLAAAREAAELREHWLWTAISRIAAGEETDRVLRDYGYLNELDLE